MSDNCGNFCRSKLLERRQRLVEFNATLNRMFKEIESISSVEVARAIVGDDLMDTNERIDNIQDHIDNYERV